MLSVGLQKAECRTAARSREVGTVTLAAERVVLTTEIPGRTTPYLVAEVRPRRAASSSSVASRRAPTYVPGSCSTRSTGALSRAVSEAEAALATAEANLPAAKARAERLRGLAEIHAVGEQDVEDAEAASHRGPRQVFGESGGAR